MLFGEDVAFGGVFRSAGKIQGQLSVKRLEAIQVLGTDRSPGRGSIAYLLNAQRTDRKSNAGAALTASGISKVKIRMAL